MGEREDRILFEKMRAHGCPLVDRRLVASEERFTAGDPTRPNPTREHPRARVIYGQDTWMNVGEWAVGDPLQLSCNARDAFPRDNGFGAQRNPTYRQTL